MWLGWSDKQWGVWGQRGTEARLHRALQVIVRSVGFIRGVMGRPWRVERRTDMTSLIFQNEFFGYWVEKWIGSGEDEGLGRGDLLGGGGCGPRER